MNRTLLQFINNRSLKPRFDEKKDKPMPLVDILAENYKTYIIESPMKPILTYEGDIGSPIEASIYFPTPFTKASESDNKKLIKETRKLIEEATKKLGDSGKITIDLRANLGGDFSVFYSALYALLPEYDNRPIINGVNSGVLVAKIEEKKGKLRIIINDNVVFEKEINPIKKWKGRVFVRINDKSMSSSQLIAIMFIDTFGRDRVLGTAPELYTNGSLSHPYYSGVVYPYYEFQDNKGKIWQGIV